MTQPGGAPWWRWGVTAVLGLGVVVALNVYFARDARRFGEGLAAGPTPELATPVAEPEVLPLTEADRRALVAMRERAAALARRHVGSVPRGVPFDLSIVQEILERAELAASDTSDLQALGVVMGDVLAAEYGMRWVKVADQYGRTAALRYRSDEHLFFPVTWVSKRVEAGLDVDVRALYGDLEALVRRIDAASGGG